METGIGVCQRKGLMLTDQSGGVYKGRGFLPEGVPARQEIEEDDPQRIDVRARVDRGGIARELLRGHVRRRPQQLAALGGESLQAKVRTSGARNPEIDDLGRAGMID